MKDERKAIHVFIISWTGMHDQAIAIANSVNKFAEYTTIVYSDIDESCELIVENTRAHKVSNSCFWGKKFETSIRECKGEILLIIHADTSCEDWRELIRKCHEVFTRHENIGVYSPLVDYTFWSQDKVHISGLVNTSLSIVAQTDGIVFAINKKVRQKMESLEYTDNIYGWGIDWAIMAFCYTNNMLAVIDRAIKVFHPKTTGYDSSGAKQQEVEFLKQLNLNETIHLRLLTQFASISKSRN